MKRTALMWYNSICIFILMLFLLQINAQQINCRKYVFAPLCRGVAAKRGEVSSVIVLSDSSPRNSNNYVNEEDGDVLNKPDSLEYPWDLIFGSLNSKSKLLMGKAANLKDSNLLYVYDYEK